MNCPHCLKPTSPHAAKCGLCEGAVGTNHMRDELTSLAAKQRRMSSQVARVRRFQRFHFFMDWIGLV